MVDTQKTPLSELKALHKIEGRFTTEVNRKAGKLLKQEGVEVALAYLQEHLGEDVFDVRPPAKASIVAYSRPPQEWPLAKVSVAIQSYLYSLSLDQLKRVVPNATSEDRSRFFVESGVPNYGYTCAQGLNAIFKHARNVYLGELKKAENRIAKAKVKHDRIQKARLNRGEPTEEFIPDSYLKSDGTLVHKPGANPVILGYQQITPKVFDPSNPGSVVLPPEYRGYKRLPTDPIEVNLVDRLAIPKGQPGYVPEHHRPGGAGSWPKINFRHRRIQRFHVAKYKGKPYVHRDVVLSTCATQAILAVMHLGDDWVVMDLRGLLRNARWRRLLPPTSTSEDLLRLFGRPQQTAQDFTQWKVTPEALLGLFSGDVVVDPIRGVVTFLYRDGVIPLNKRDLITTKKSVEVLQTLTKNAPIALASLDLGQTNPVSTRVSIISQVDSTLKAEYSNKFFLPQDLLNEIQGYRMQTDAFQDLVNAEALAALSIEQQAEVRYVYEFSAAEAKQKVCQRFSLPEDAIPWSDMSSWSTHIADWVTTHGDSCLVWVPTFGKGNKPKVKKDGSPQMQKLTDSRIANLQGVRPRLSQSTRDQLNANKFKLMFGHPEYHRLALRKREFSRRVVNHIIREAKIATSLTMVAFAIENLQVRMLHGSGKRDLGWDNYFVPKRENRWYMQALHKAVSDLATNRGVPIVEVCASWTSCTCPKCAYCDKSNRDGETFVCLKCGHRCNADLDTATFNIEQVALTGKGLLGPIRERTGAAKKTGSSRKLKSPKIQGLGQGCPV